MVVFLASVAPAKSRGLFSDKQAKRAEALDVLRQRDLQAELAFKSWVRTKELARRREARAERQRRRAAAEGRKRLEDQRASAGVSHKEWLRARRSHKYITLQGSGGKKQAKRLPGDGDKHDGAAAARQLRPEWCSDPGTGGGLLGADDDL